MPVGLADCFYLNCLCLNDKQADNDNDSSELGPRLNSHGNRQMGGVFQRHIKNIRILKTFLGFKTGKSVYFANIYLRIRRTEVSLEMLY